MLPRRFVLVGLLEERICLQVRAQSRFVTADYHLSFHCQQSRRVYKAAILTSLLYGAESWVLYRRHVRKLEQFHVRCLRRIAHVRWLEKKPNTEVLQICGIAGIEAFLLTAQLRCTGHVVRMNDDRLPKIICSGVPRGGDMGECPPPSWIEKNF